MAKSFVQPKYWVKLFGGTVPPPKKLFGGTVPPPKNLFGGTIPPNNFLR